MKKVFKILGAIVAVIIIIVVAAFTLTSGVADSADKFFTLIKENKTKEAYDSTAKEFQAATSYDQFTAFLTGSSMGKYVSGNWSSRSIENNQGSLQGSITTSDKGEIPVEMNFVNEEGKWKVLNLKPVSGGLQPTTSTTSTTSTTTPAAKDSTSTTPAAAAVPGDAEITSLANGSMTAFAKAIKADDFTDFYGSVSNLWKSQTTADELKGIFKTFVDNKIDLSFVADSTPSFSEKPALNDQNFLVLTGYYPSKEMTALFTLKYVYEYPAWKLVGINVNVK